MLTIEEAVQLCDVPEGHMKKVVRTLSGAGVLQGIRGRGGGFRLGRPASEISLGEVLRLTETDFAMVECFQADNACPLTCDCGLIGVVREARSAFLAPFNARTLSDIC